MREAVVAEEVDSGNLRKLEEVVRNQMAKPSHFATDLGTGVSEKQCIMLKYSLIIQ